MAWKTLPESNHSSFRSSLLIVLAVLAVLAVSIFAFGGFSDDKGRGDGGAPNAMDKPAESQGIGSDAQGSPETASNDGSKQISGSVLQVSERKDVQGKWITLASDALEQENANEGNSSTGSMMKNSGATYRFYVASDVEGASSVQGGLHVKVSFFGDPSEENYMPVYKVEVLQ